MKKVFCLLRYQKFKDILAKLIEYINVSTFWPNMV